MENNDKYIALSFDDGPSNVTESVIEKLQKYGVVATFFLVGDNITAALEPAVKKAYDFGCEIANHSKTHSNMTMLTAEQIAEEIAFTSARAESITGEKPTMFRPPYIAVNQLMIDTVKMTFIAGYGCRDWEESVSARERTEMILSQICHGGIILMHDAEDNVKTVEALDLLIPELIKRGYKFTTVSNLFTLCGATPDHSKVYTNVFQEHRYMVT
ncbi:MAG: polysaccharide deacetylase family protein [Oscillospiraceae bacterium]|nr:polysaccharide deacetylase family protein [Oscillospiraceae bacterium]